MTSKRHSNKINFLSLSFVSKCILKAFLIEFQIEAKMRCKKLGRFLLFVCVCFLWPIFVFASHKQISLMENQPDGKQALQYSTPLPLAALAC